MDKAGFRDFVIAVVRRIDNEPGFELVPRGWVVERTFGWLTRWRRLVRDYEQPLDVSEAMIHGKHAAAPYQPLILFSNGLLEPPASTTTWELQVQATTHNQHAVAGFGGSEGWPADSLDTNLAGSLVRVDNTVMARV